MVEIRANVPDGRLIINSRKDRKEIASFSLFGYSHDKIYSLLFGKGNIPYHDYEINAEATVGLHGKYYVRIHNAEKLYMSLSKEEILPQDVEVFVKKIISDIAGQELAKQIQGYGYDTINSRIETMNTNIMTAFGPRLMEYGLILVNVSIEGINFCDEYVEERKKHFAKIKEKEEKRKDEKDAIRSQRDEVGIIKDLLEATEKTIIVEKKVEKEEEKPVQPKLAKKFCTNCGAENPVDAKFCRVCGKPQK